MHMNRTRKQVNKARQSGMSNVDVARMKAIAKKQAELMEQEAIEKAFLFMLAIPLNVLVNDYWSKTAKRKAPKFIEDVVSLYESVQAGVVSHEELADLLDEYAGVDIQAEWMNRKTGEKNG